MVHDGGHVDEVPGERPGHHGVDLGAGGGGEVEDRADVERDGRPAPPIAGQVDVHRFGAPGDFEAGVLPAVGLRWPRDLDGVAGPPERLADDLGDRAGPSRLGAEQVDVFGVAGHHAVGHQGVPARQGRSRALLHMPW